MAVCQNCGILPRLLVELPSCGIGISIGKKCRRERFFLILKIDMQNNYPEHPEYRIFSFFTRKEKSKSSCLISFLLKLCFTIN